MRCCVASHPRWCRTQTAGRIVGHRVLYIHRNFGNYSGNLSSLEASALPQTLEVYHLYIVLANPRALFNTLNLSMPVELRVFF